MPHEVVLATVLTDSEMPTIMALLFCSSLIIYTKAVADA